MEPSRTHQITMVALGIELLLAVGVLFVSPESAAHLATIGVCVAGLGGAGAGAMAYRDGASGGLTSSAGDRVLKARAMGGGE